MIKKTSLVDCIPLREHTWISLVGGGGKTTLMQELARAYCSLGKCVLMTTTTKVQSPDIYNWDADFIFTDSSSIKAFVPSGPCSVLYAEKSDIVGRIVSPDFETLEDLKTKFDVVICEADGSRHLPIKVHTERDPVIPEFSDWTICIVGFWAFGQPALSCTFGLPENKKEKLVDINFLNWYLKDEEGLLKRTTADKRCILLTKSETIGKEYLEFFDKSEEVVFLR